MEFSRTKTYGIDDYLLDALTLSHLLCFIGYLWANKRDMSRAWNLNVIIFVRWAKCQLAIANAQIAPNVDSICAVQLLTLRSIQIRSFFFSRIFPLIRSMRR